MDNIQIILYIAFVAIAIISRLMKSKNKAPKARPRQQQPTNGDAPMSFEDLLKEFTGESEKTEPVTTYPPEQETLSDYRRTEQVYDDEEAKRVYESAVKDSRKFQPRDKPSNKKPDRPIYGHFAKYEEEDTVANELFTMLKDEDGIRKAVILSEILNRKY